LWVGGGGGGLFGGCCWEGGGPVVKGAINRIQRGSYTGVQGDGSGLLWERRRGGILKEGGRSQLGVGCRRGSVDRVGGEKKNHCPHWPTSRRFCTGRKREQGKIAFLDPERGRVLCYSEGDRE